MLAKDELLDKVFDRVRELLPEDRAPRVEEFVRQYYAWMAPEDLEARDVVDLYGAALAHLNFARRREPGTAKVRVYNPRHEESGWQSTHTAVEIVTDDMPFLVDSVTMELNRRGFAVHLVIHPVMQVRRDAEGRLVEILPPEAPDEDGADGALPESVIHAEVDRHTEPESLERLCEYLRAVLGEVRAAVEDWPKMREKARGISAGLEDEAPPVDADDVSEAAAFLRWIDDHHFTFLGYREYDLREEGGEEVLRAVPDSGLGISRDAGSSSESAGFARLSPEARKRTAHERRLLTLTKANSRSTVHRPSYLDYVGVRRFDDSGEVVGERRFLGLYTTSAYKTDPREIPLVRRKIRAVLRRAAFPPGSHYEKGLLDTLESYPRDQLFQISEDELFGISMGMLHLQERQRVRLFVRPDTYGRFLSCLVFVPRDRYDTSTRERMQGVLRRALGGTRVEFSVRLTESVLARIHFVVYTEGPGEIPSYDAGEIEQRLAEAARAWPDSLYGALVERCGEEIGVELFNRYRDAFPVGYRDEFLARTAVADISDVEELSDAGDMRTRLYHPLEAPDDALRFKMFCRGEQVPLSDVVPILENMGVRVVDQRPFEVRPAGAGDSGADAGADAETDVAWIYDFGLTYDDDAEGRLRPEEIEGIFRDAFARAWNGAAENDGFNRLVLRAGLHWRRVSVLRAYSRYLRQTGVTFSQTYIEETLTAAPHVARLLVELFEARFDPARQGRAQRETERLEAEITEALDAVASLDQDRILRSFLSVTLATLRTNYYQSGEDGEEAKPHLSFKLDPALIPELPLPRPMFEVFVYSPRTEGVHLRGGRVARGGIRHSDRREDFRTEVLGLMKAQMAKNAVIVPVGAKGGFVVKRPPAGGGREAFVAEAKECYRILIRGMLDLTDDIVDDEIAPPGDVVRYDEDDPYLVVAADKGTATFSDTANELSDGYGFWLGDAFASGGSAGYDHKEMGITARGAWESVKRHFRELGKDVGGEDFTTVGIGDMSGDVFGNGMLLSRHTKLVGAFNHLHVFLDPDPDPEKSYAERERLFGMARSSWSDYDADLISEGGGVFSRQAKSVPLSPRVKELLEVEEDSLTPSEVVRALLKADVDLLWNGGIGTYVKARSETNAAAGDRTNDAVRINGDELRCRVVGEGGNLGFTQRGRVEFALRGGRINTDAIDNSAGVDCSDHEVNIKILLDAVVASGDMTGKQRNELLAEMTDEVAALVLRDNYEQTRALANAVVQAAPMVDVHARYIRHLENAGILSRELEALPDDDALSERKQDGGGLTAPEFAVLLAHTKLKLYGELLDSDAPEDPYLSGELERYFPAVLGRRFLEPMEEHRLRRELVATRVSNEVVNRAGTTFVFRMGEETGADAPRIARAYAAAREVFDMRSLWAGVEALDDRVASETQTEMLLDARKLVERATRWLLRNRRAGLDVAETISHFSEGTTELARRIPDLLLDGDRKALEEAAERLAEAGVPQDLARRAATLNPLFSALDVVDIAARTGEPVEAVGAVYFTLGDRLRLHWLRARVEDLPRQDRWQTLARAALRDDLYALQAEFTAGVLRAAVPEETDAPARVEAWVESNQGAVERSLQVLRDVNASGAFGLSTLSVALRELRNLATQSGASRAEAEAPAR